MKNRAVQIISFVFGIVLATAMQDLSPSFAGVKPPFVIAAILFMAFLAPLPLALVVAAVAGLFVDALTGLPVLCATSFLPLLALGSHFVRKGLPEVPSPMVGAISTLVAAAIGEVWLTICGFSAVGTELFVRVCAAALLAAPAGAALFALLPWLCRHIGLEDVE